MANTKFFKKLSDYVASMNDDVKTIKKANSDMSIMKGRDFTQEVVRSLFEDFDQDDQARILLLVENTIYTQVSNETPLTLIEGFIFDLFDVKYSAYNYFTETVDMSNWDSDVKIVLDGPEGSQANDIIIFSLAYFKKYFC